MKILLIQPPFTIFKTETRKCHPPLGLAYLAGALKDSHKVAVVDALVEGYHQQEPVRRGMLRHGLNFEEIKERISYFGPDIVAVSCLFSSQAENTHNICRIAKQVDKKIITVLGGAHPSVLAQESLEDVNVDFVVIGEGEDTLKKLSECLEYRKDFRGIEGLAFRSDSKIQINARKIFMDNLDSLALPFWEIFPLERYFAINNPHGGHARYTPFLPVLTSRGCPFKCVFCSVHNLWGSGYRIRSAKNVLSEIRHLTDKFGIKEILFEDDNLTFNKERAREIFFDLIAQGDKLAWSLPNGVLAHTLDDDMLELMKKSGCYSISIGIESADEFILDRFVRKPVVLSKIKSIVHKARQLGLETSVFFIVGFPGEKLENLKKTFRFARDLKADNNNFFFATPLPGSELLELCKRNNLIDNKLDYTTLKSDYPSFATEYFSKEELYHIVWRQKLKLQLISIARNPFRYLFKLIAKLSNDPKYFVRFLMQCNLRAVYEGKP